MTVTNHFLSSLFLGKSSHRYLVQLRMLCYFWVGILKIRRYCTDDGCKCLWKCINHCHWHLHKALSNQKWGYKVSVVELSNQKWGYKVSVVELSNQKLGYKVRVVKLFV